MGCVTSVNEASEINEADFLRPTYEVPHFHQDEEPANIPEPDNFSYNVNSELDILSYHLCRNYNIQKLLESVISIRGIVHIIEEFRGAFPDTHADSSLGVYEWILKRQDIERMPEYLHLIKKWLTNPSSTMRIRICNIFTEIGKKYLPRVIPYHCVDSPPLRSHYFYAVMHHDVNDYKLDYCRQCGGQSMEKIKKTAPIPDEVKKIRHSKKIYEKKNCLQRENNFSL